MTKKLCEFSIKINGGKEKTIKVKSGVYVAAVAAIPALLDIPPNKFPLTIEIWSPKLLPDYGPYFYYIEKQGDRVGLLCKKHDGSQVVIYS